MGVFDGGMGGGLGHYFVILSFCHFVILVFWGLGRRYPGEMTSLAFFINTSS